MLDNDPTTTDNNEDDRARATAAPGTPPDARPDRGTDQGPEAPAVNAADTPGTDPGLNEQKPAKKAAAKRAAKAPAKKAAAKRTTVKRTTAKKAAKSVASDVDAGTPAEDALPLGVSSEATGDASVEAPVEKPKKKAAARKRSPAKRAVADDSAMASGATPATDATDAGTTSTDEPSADPEAAAPAAPMVLFKAPEPTKASPRKRTTRKVAAVPVPQTDEDTAEEDTAVEVAADAAQDDDSGTEDTDDRSQGAASSRGGRGRGQGGNRGGRSGQRGRGADSAQDPESESPDADDQDDSDDAGDDEGGNRRRRRRGGRRRRKSSDSEGGESNDTGEDQPDDQDDSDETSSDSSNDLDGDGEGAGSRRRRRRRRPGDDGDGSGDDSGNGGQRARKQRNPEDEITSIGGSTRLEAKKQRRREGREAGRRRAPIVSEAEFLTRRESVDRVMVIRQKDDLTQIGVLEDKVLVEHYVARESQTSLIGNVYLGRVQNVLPSMEAAFIDIGKGRNAVLYAGEVNWAAVGHKDGQQRKIESVLSSGQTILVQVSKDPVGHKGARLTGQVSLPGRFLVYVPDGNTSGISRKLPDTERSRLKTLLKKIVPESAGVIVRTAAEGATEEELTLDVERLTARWADIEEKVKAGKSPQMLYGEPDLTLKVVRDLFTEDFGKLVVQGDDAWDLVSNYVSHVAPDLQERLERFEPGQDGSDGKKDLFATYRVDEQIAKGLDRKVWLPSGGSLVIDRTEAMTVVDVNTGKFTGSGGNLEETVTKNNLEAAEEMVRQLRLRDIGGIIVIDFIDMVLESNRDLVLRRLVECLGRDRTRHQVAEVTSLGLVQMTRKRIGTGLVEAFSTDCDACKGRGLVLHEHPVEAGSGPDDDDSRGRGRGRSGRNRGGGRGNDNAGGNGNNGAGAAGKPSPADLAKIRPQEKQHDDGDRNDADLSGADQGAADGSAPRQDPQQAQVRVEAPVEVPVEQAVIGRPTGISPEPQDVASESAATDETPAALEAVESPAGEAPVPPPAPRAVTSTRRRTARRPAGPPSALAEVAPPPGAGKQALKSAEPVDVPVEPTAPGHAPDSASDPTSTPEAVAEPDPRVDDDSQVSADPTWPGSGADEDETGESGDETVHGNSGDGDDESGTGFSLSHVPVKRKGSRKR